MYAKRDIKSMNRTIYAKQGEIIEVYNKPHENVWLCRNDKDVCFPCSPDSLSNDPIQFTAAILPEPTSRASTKPLTQIEKIQLEYLNSLK